LIVGALTMLFFSSPVRADSATLYVDGSNPNCSDTGPGTDTQPFCRIGAAAARVSAGQTVQVAAGTYSENVTVPVSGTAIAPIVFTAAPGATVTLTGHSNGFSISGRSWITVVGFTVTNTTSYGISVSNASHITLLNNNLSNAGQPVSGQMASGVRLGNVTDSLLSGNTSHHNSDHGINIAAGSTRNEVRSNFIFNNAEVFQRAAAGIRLSSSPGNIVAGNISHDNEDSGIESVSGSNNTVLYNNVTYKNGDHGIDNLQTTGQTVIANTVYKNVTAGINVEGNSTGATIANNVSVDNGIASPRTKSNIRVEQGSTSGTSMDSDLVYLTTPSPLLIWNSISYTTLASFRSATGQEPHGIQDDPRWTSPSTGDFQLIAGSPAIDSADSGVSNQPSSDVEGHIRLDDPGTPNTGLGPRPYDDRGAYEYGSSVSDLSLTKSASPDPVLAGQTLTYTLTAANAGPSSATGVSLTDTLPAGVTYQSATPSQGSCTQASGTVSCSLGTLDASGQATVQIEVTPQSAGSLTNSAQVSAEQVDPSSANNSAIATTTVITETGYPRPKGATPLHASLVPAFAECTAPNSAHGPPLASPSCSTPVQTSSFLTVGTPDANGAAPKSIGSLDEKVVPGDSTPPDEADVVLTVSLTDVRRQADLSDYTGELGTELTLRITDKNNGVVPGGTDQATVQDFTFSFAVSCAPTEDAAVGATCQTATTADTVAPGAVVESKRSIWEGVEVRVMDGGADGLYSTPDNTQFATSGLFVP
jgi:uncharacterized repeat protein (TIGR01451 family)